MIKFMIIKILMLASILSLLGCKSFKAKLDYHNPSERFINIEGDIISGWSYEIRVKYITVGSSKECKWFSYSAGKYLSQVTEYSYFPEINNTKHKIHIPLKKLNPNTKCKWVPSSIYIIVDGSEIKHSAYGSLFVVSSGKHHGNDSINIECSDYFCFRVPRLPDEHINIFNKTYKVNIAKKSSIK